jgi:hypothetical protein
MKKKFNDFDASPLYTVPKFDDIPMAFNNKKQSLKNFQKTNTQAYCLTTKNI